MKKIIFSSLLITACLLTACRGGNNPTEVGQQSGFCTLARGDLATGGKNVLYRCNGRAILQTAQAQRFLNKFPIQVSFDQIPGQVIKQNDITHQSANASGRTDAVACERAVINAAAKFQRTAAKNGARGVSNLHSWFEKQPITGGEVICQAGTFHARVVMRADYVR
ncbi:MAG: hypothetical protein J6M05_02820 [Cardiobacteriaceae bacterium]|nr:hypothetical protein [Cardiobacteriaceae bacterium]